MSIARAEIQEDRNPAYHNDFISSRNPTVFIESQFENPRMPPQQYVWPDDNDSNLLQYLQDFHSAFWDRCRTVNFTTSLQRRNPYTIAIKGNKFYTRKAFGVFEGIYIMDFIVQIESSEDHGSRLHLKGSYLLSIPGSYTGEEKEIDEYFDCRGFRMALNTISESCAIISQQAQQERERQKRVAREEAERLAWEEENDLW